MDEYIIKQIYSDGKYVAQQLMGEIVRCKDCKHYIKSLALNRMCCYVHLLSPHAMREDDFCSLGERKDNETTEGV